MAVRQSPSWLTFLPFSAVSPLPHGVRIKIIWAKCFGKLKTLDKGKLLSTLLSFHPHSLVPSCSKVSISCENGLLARSAMSPALAGGAAVWGYRARDRKKLLAQTHGTGTGAWARVWLALPHSDGHSSKLSLGKGVCFVDNPQSTPGQ